MNKVFEDSSLPVRIKLVRYITIDHRSVSQSAGAVPVAELDARDKEYLYDARG